MSSRHATPRNIAAERHGTFALDSPRATAPSAWPALLAVAAFWTARGIARLADASVFQSFMTQAAGCVVLLVFFVVCRALALDAHAGGAVPDGAGTTARVTPSARHGLPPCLQPHAAGPGRLLLAGDEGLTALELRREGTRWSATELWSSRAFKPSFDDFVVHRGFVYGFDAGILCCVDASSGQRAWKEGRYGYGQVLLVPEPALLLVAAEDGEAVLLAADPERHQELGRFQALEGKTWNHPLVARARLYLRNAEEVACYELAPPRAR